ncbi:hypothetical protein CC86DRAFT_180711, partial [Ophiobolus disseminans]
MKSKSVNCYAALKYLRAKLGGFTIWGDAVCINQNDEWEKSGQLPLMGDIYTKAESVFLWLGEGTTSTDTAMRYLSSAGLHKYHITTEGGMCKSRPRAAAWYIYKAKWSSHRYPIPFGGNRRPRKEYSEQYANIE